MSARLDAAPLQPHGVYSLLGALAAVLAPHALRIPVWVSIAVAAALTWRAWLAGRGASLPRKWVLLPLAVIGTAAVVVSYGPHLGRDASVALLAVMLALKVLELKTLRDAMVAVCLGFFLIVTNFLYSQSIATALYMLAAMAWFTVILIALEDRVRSLTIQQKLGGAATLMLQGAPLMLVLFLLFPRVQGPIFGLPQATSAGVTGLSDSMSPGSLSQLGLSDEVAFRVQFHARSPAPQGLYWRGPVLWDFDGRTWTAASVASIGLSDVLHETAGAPVSYTVTLEPHYARWVFALEVPDAAPAGTVLTGDYQLLSLRPIRNRLRYDAASHLGYRYGGDERPELLRRALRLPSGYNPRSVQLAREIRERSGADADVVANVLQLFRSQPFFYTLVPPELGRDSMDEFLFSTRRGFCEHYASAFVFLMRAAGVPARVVTGYQGGEINPLGNYMIVRQSEAHAWAEVWLNGQGWIRVDPTAAVSPARIQVGIAAAVSAADPLPISVRGSFQLLNRLHFAWDAVANSWNQWVLGYTPERQTRLLTDAGFGAATWQTLATLLMGVAAAVVAVLALLILRRLRAMPSDPVARTWLAFCRKLARRGTRRRADEGPRDFARRAASEQPGVESKIADIAELYITLRYAGSGNKGHERRLRDLVGAL